MTHRGYFGHSGTIFNELPILSKKLVQVLIGRFVSFLEGDSSDLREKQCLLLLDNFEQVVDADPDIAELLATCPRLIILVTSRAALHISGEHEFPLLPLALPDGTSPLAIHELTQYAAVPIEPCWYWMEYPP